MQMKSTVINLYILPWFYNEQIIKLLTQARSRMQQLDSPEISIEYVIEYKNHESLVVIDEKGLFIDIKLYF